MKILLTGATGMLGHYVQQLFKDDEITTLGRSSSNKVVCDLRENVPSLDADASFDLVVHAAGSKDRDTALEVNLEGTRNLLKALKGRAVQQMIFISCCDVYGKLSGDDISETDHTWTRDNIGQSKILAEGEVADYARDNGVLLTILRPVTMIGKGRPANWIDNMFQQVSRGTYIHIRDSRGERSLVTAYDVARLIKHLAGHPEHGGTIYNVSDGRKHPLLKIAEAMSANRGSEKRMWTLPAKWASVVAQLRLPGLMNRQIIEERNRSLTFSSDKLIQATGFEFLDSLKVLARTEKSFPYEDD